MHTILNAFQSWMAVFWSLYSSAMVVEMLAIRLSRLLLIILRTPLYSTWIIKDTRSGCSNWSVNIKSLNWQLRVLPTYWQKCWISKRIETLTVLSRNFVILKLSSSQSSTLRNCSIQNALMQSYPYIRPILRRKQQRLRKTNWYANLF